MGHQIRVVCIFGGRNLWCKNGDSGKHKEQRETDNGRRISKNPIQRKLQLAYSWVLLLHVLYIGFIRLIGFIGSIGFSKLQLKQTQPMKPIKQI